MLNLKKTAVAVLALSGSAAFAGTMGPVCAPGPVTIPCEMTAWDFGGQALYMQPVYDADFGYIGQFVNSTTGETNYIERAPKWGWGFQIEGSYHFNTGNDLDVNWYHYSQSTTRDFTATEDNDTTQRVWALNFKPQWDQVNIELGQHVDLGDFEKFRFHGGVEFARVKTSDTANVYTTAGVYNHNQSQTYTMNGFGPRTGLDMAYQFGNGFAVYAKPAASLLIGTTKFSYFTGLTTHGYNGSKTAMVPELEAKLGLTYDYALASGDLTLDVGYMWLNYFNAQHGLRTPFLSRQEGVVESDFAMNGLYFGLKWLGNLA